MLLLFVFSGYPMDIKWISNGYVNDNNLINILIMTICLVII